MRTETRVEGVAAGDLIRAFPGLRRGFWERADRWCAWAGSAARLALSGTPDGGRFRAVRRWAEATAERLVAEAGARDGASPERPGAARFHGGFAFDPRPPPAGRRGRPPPADLREGGRGGPDGEAWPGFPAALFHLPAIELRAEGGELRLAVTVERDPIEETASSGEAPHRALRRVRARIARASGGAAGGDGRPRRRGQAADGDARRAAVRTVGRRPDPGRWGDVVETALEEIRSGRLEKVVPARTIELELAAAPDPVVLVDRLRTANPASLPYLVEPEPGRAFAGAAPEIVAALRGGRFHATAVAGTVADSADPGERERLAHRLLSSGKDRREHEIGVRDMRRALRDAAGVARVDQEPRVLRLRGVQHLLTNVTAEVPGDMHVLDLLEALHPTAAVNGSPRGAAREFLRREEPFDRGWYAGPVGWFDTAGDGEFAPGLRSVLVRGRRARIFAGAGIVEGSVARREWRETGLKFRPALEALGIDPDEVADARPETAASGVSPDV